MRTTIFSFFVFCMICGICSCNTEDIYTVSKQPEIQNELAYIAKIESRALSNLSVSRDSRSESGAADTLTEVAIEDLLFLVEELDTILSKYQDLCIANPDIASLPEDTLKMMLLDKEIFCDQIYGKVSSECSSMCNQILVDGNPVPTKVIANSNTSFNEKVAVQTLSTALEMNVLGPSSLEVKVKKSCEDQLEFNKKDCCWVYLSKSALAILIGVALSEATAGGSVIGMVVEVGQETYDLANCMKYAQMEYELCKEREKNINQPRQ